MFSLRLNVSLRSSNAGGCIASVNNRRNFRRFLDSTNNERAVKVLRINNNLYSSFTSRAINANSLFKRNLTSDETHQKFQSRSLRGYSTDDHETSRENVFGDLGDRQFENVEMDEDEKKEEKFVENEARVFRCHKLTPGGYANLIKSHIGKGNLDAALEVLDMVAKNRDQPTTYMYNLLLRAHAVVGNFKKSRSLYVTMKKRGLKCNAATYTSIINACANYHHSPTALEYLGDLRQEFTEKNIVLNETHYNAMIKAYGRHNSILEAFAIADEMRDKRLSTNIVTFNSLLIGTISDREAGLRHAIVIWHFLKRHAIKPTITTYNLLLRAMRDTKLGDLRVNDVLIAAPPRCQIVFNDSLRPNLLSNSPTVSSLVIKELGSYDETDENTSPKITIPNGEANLPAILDPNTGEKSLTVEQIELIKTPLEKIRNKNRLILFGGVTGILESMESYGVEPDVKSITLLMELMPPSSKCERSILNTARAKSIPLDIDFFNMLMKKRSLRRDYEGAKEILDDIQRHGLCPDIITWGILALGCKTSEDARNLIDGMRVTGHRLNVVIAGTLINIACRRIRFGYILEMMEMMVHYRIKPNWELYCTLDRFQQEMHEKIKSKKFYRTVNHPAFKTGFAKFNLRYPTWQKQMERNTANKPKMKPDQRQRDSR